MNTLNLGRYGFSIGAATLMLAACGTMQPPIGARSAMTQTSATASSHKVLYFFEGYASPEAPLIDVNGTLYGTTVFGGSSGAGTVYSVSTNGTTYYGGGTDCSNRRGCGTIYRVRPTGSEKVVHAFGGATMAQFRLRA